MTIAHLIEKLQSKQHEPMIYQEGSPDVDSLRQKLKVIELENRLLRAEIQAQDEVLKSLRPLLDT